MIRLRKEIRTIGRDFLNEGETEVYRFPKEWSLREYSLKDIEALGEEGIQEAISREFPYKGDTSSLDALMKGKKSAVILIDDITRPTPAYEVVPHLLNRLTEAGIAQDEITFIFAIGTHRPLTEEEMAMKIGKEAVRKYRVENHDAFNGDFADLGYTSYGTPVRINKKVVEADLVITLGTLAKHRFVYACGGSKIIVPGVAHQETILKNHKGMAEAQREEGQKFGKTSLDMD